jgi:hypothetical protein
MVNCRIYPRSLDEVLEERPELLIPIVACLIFSCLGAARLRTLSD